MCQKAILSVPTITKHEKKKNNNLQTREIKWVGRIKGDEEEEIEVYLKYVKADYKSNIFF